MALAEKGVTIPIQTVDLRGGENRREPYLTQINPVGQLPTLELDEGTMLTETRMWVRRLDLNIVEPMTSGYRYSEGLKFFQRRMRCIPQAADDLKAIAQHWLGWLDGRLTGPYICGDRFTLADIHLFAFLDFGAKVGQPLDPAKLAIAGWYDRVKARPSAAA
jgi:glutathione S-transferase